MDKLIFLHIRESPLQLPKCMEPTPPCQTDGRTLVLAGNAVQTALHGLPIANEWQHAIPNALGIETNCFVRANRFFQFLR